MVRCYVLLQVSERSKYKYGTFDLAYLAVDNDEVSFFIKENFLIIIYD